ncbi:hypothetical protein VTO73DRAFT_14273 [Trametes versicolor]
MPPHLRTRLQVCKPLQSPRSIVACVRGSLRPEAGKSAKRYLYNASRYASASLRSESKASRRPRHRHRRPPLG